MLQQVVHIFTIVFQRVKPPQKIAIKLDNICLSDDLGNHQMPVANCVEETGLTTPYRSVHCTLCGGKHIERFVYYCLSHVTQFLPTVTVAF
jgi:hypothetical protein